MNFSRAVPASVVEAGSADHVSSLLPELPRLRTQRRGKTCRSPGQ
ncbi:putative Disintegrin and metalloprotein, partial [Naja naja]